ncbi:MAG: hypothetical protein U5R46_17530 [Gammaproteobacteria bacterium]|nr:hypothetical protein [Gammaproteobacteria bacterium]
MTVSNDFLGAATPGGQSHQGDDGYEQDDIPLASLVENVFVLPSVLYVCGRHWLAKCPVCQEERPPLLITETDRQPCALFCFVGCRNEENLAAVYMEDVASGALLEVCHG